MTNAEIIKALKDAAMYINYVAPNCYASIEAKEAIRAAADALEASQKALDECAKQLADMAAKLPKEGEWIIRDYDMNTYEEFERSATDKDDGKDAVCSVCGYHALMNGHEDSVHSNYCPNCGARMKGEHDGNL